VAGAVISIEGVYESIQRPIRGRWSSARVARAAIPMLPGTGGLYLAGAVWMRWYRSWIRVSRTATGSCLLLTYGTNEHMQSWDGEFLFVVDQMALKETRNGFRILVSQRTSAEQSR
jgi:hypothetical protein